MPEGHRLEGGPHPMRPPIFPPRPSGAPAHAPLGKPGRGRTEIAEAPAQPFLEVSLILDSALQKSGKMGVEGWSAELAGLLQQRIEDQ